MSTIRHTSEKMLRERRYVDSFRPVIVINEKSVAQLDLERHAQQSADRLARCMAGLGIGGKA